jgi:hypothetical protein
MITGLWHGLLPWAPMMWWTPTAVVCLGGTCGQPESGHREAARQQCPGNDPLQGVGGVHLVFPFDAPPRLASSLARAQRPVRLPIPTNGRWHRSRKGYRGRLGGFLEARRFLATVVSFASSTPRSITVYSGRGRQTSQRLAGKGRERKSCQSVSTLQQTIQPTLERPIYGRYIATFGTMVFDAIGELFRAGEAQLDRDSEEGFELRKAAPSARNAKGDDAATVSRVMDIASLRRLHNLDRTRGAGCGVRAIRAACRPWRVQRICRCASLIRSRPCA